MIGQVQEASELLSPETIQDSWFSEFNLEPEQLLQEGTKTASQRVANKNEFPQTGNQARLITYLNLCSMFCISKDFDKARSCLANISNLGVETTHPNAVLLAVYIELQMGNVGSALQLIKRHQYLSATRVDKKKAKKS